MISSDSIPNSRWVIRRDFSLRCVDDLFSLRGTVLLASPTARALDLQAHSITENARLVHLSSLSHSAESMETSLRQGCQDVGQLQSMAMEIGKQLDRLKPYFESAHILLTDDNQRSSY